MSKLFKNKFFKDPQNIIAVGVTIISLCALIVSLIQTKVLKEEHELMRQHSRASVWPRLVFGRSKSHNLEDNSINKFTLNVANKGVGPAIITDIKVSYNDTVVNNWGELFEAQKIPDSIKTHITNSKFNGAIITAGETIEILNLDVNLPLANEFFKRIKGLSIKVYYESIYGEKWKNDYNGQEIIKLENFEGLPKKEQFLN